MSTLERALEAGLRIRPGEQRRVALMAAYAANAIGAVVVGRSVRDALYLSAKASTGAAAKGLAGMYVYSSIAIVLVSWLYARVADKANRGALNAASALMCGAFCAGFWALLRMSSAPVIYAALYIFVEAMGSLVVIQFWTMANDVFHAREAKRLFGLIGGGGTLANVIFGLLVGRYAKTIGAHNLLWLMVGQLIACALLARAGAKLSSTMPVFAQRVQPQRKARLLSRAGLSFLSNKHLGIVALIGAVSAAAVIIVDFQFKLSAASALKENELAAYFGKFYGVCGGIALAIQIWVTGRVLERYGILASLLPLPVGLAFGSATAAAIPNPSLFYSSLAKGSDTIFRYTINDASMQLLYVPVQPHVRGRAKAFIDGILKPTACALTGAVLLFYKQSGGSGRPLALAVILLVGLWILLLVRARGEYVRSLVESLERRHLDLSGSAFSGVNEATLNALRTALKGEPATVLHALTLVQQLAHSADFTPELRELLRHEDPEIRAAAVAQLGELQRADSLEEMRALLADPVPDVRAAALGAVCAIEQERAVPTVLPFLDIANAPEAVVRAAAAVALIRHAGLDGVLAAAEPLKQLLAAEDPRDRAAAADALGNIGVRGFYRPLLSFLRDPDPRVRRRAIAAAGKLRTPELIPALVEQFQRRETALEAASALASFGPGIEPQLQGILLDESAHVDCRRGVALVLQRLQTRESADALLGALTARETEVRRAAARALSRLARKQRGITVEAARVERAVHAELAGARTALGTFKKLSLPVPAPNQPPRTAAELLGVALLEERDARLLQALLLLEVLLPDVRLDVVAENLRSESAAARGNAIEVLDNALPEPWKRLLMAALDEVKRRGDAVVADPRPPPELAAALIGGESGLWVGACTARFITQAQVPLQPLMIALQNALNSPYPPLREAAALAVAQGAPQDAPRLLSALLADAAASVSRTVRALLSAAPRAIA
ncbi:MAG TPA: Npt1/Npt2 family nucleotide transporter [Myxococcales bacterium]|nr:Npt1/Npt2 family nucleotide transporter [Myxococcales bacterium]